MVKVVPQSYGIIGSPITHSLSPIMQQAAFDVLNIDARYESWEVAVEDLAACVQTLKKNSVGGFNVTVPHKVSILSYLDALDASAQAVGAVNTVVATPSGWVGHNTDVHGFSASLQAAGVSLKDKTMLVIGTGGAARAIIAAGVMGGAHQVLIAGRNLNAAEKIVSDFKNFSAGYHANISAHLLQAEVLADVLSRSHIIAQATSATMNVTGRLDPISALIPWRSMSQQTVCLDIVYKPQRTMFLQEAERHGAKTIDGLGMLLHQGARAFELWTQRIAPIEIMRAALNEALFGKDPVSF